MDRNKTNPELNSSVTKLSKCAVTEEELKNIRQVFNDAYLGMGKQVVAFESELKKFLGTYKEVICVNSGTAALHLALSCLDIGPGDEILVPTITYAACFQAISATGAKPVPCDIIAETGSIDLASAQSLVSAHTKAIMPVHYASHVHQYEALYDFAKTHHLRVVEDAAHAFGTLHDGQWVGANGDIICFSFDGIKNITCGEGGAIVTDDQKMIERLRNRRVLAIEKTPANNLPVPNPWDFDIKDQGFRYHMSDIMAAIGRAQLLKLKNFRCYRQKIVNYYLKNLKNIPYLSLLKLDYKNMMPHIFVIRISDAKRNGLKAFLLENQIETGIHYKPNHYLTRYQCNYQLPVADKFYEEVLTLPVHIHITETELANIVTRIKEFLHG